MYHVFLINKVLNFEFDLNSIYNFYDLILLYSRNSHQSTSQAGDWLEKYKAHCNQTMRSLNAGSTLFCYALNSHGLPAFSKLFEDKVSGSKSQVDDVTLDG